MIHEKLIEYLSNIALKHKEINHTEDQKGFYSFDVSQIVNDDTVIKYPILFFNPMGFFYRTNNGGLTTRENLGMFSVLDTLSNYPDIESKDDQLLALYKRTERIGNDILAKIMNDLEESNNCDVPDMDMNRVSGSTTAHPEIPNVYGHQFQFQLKNPVKLKYDEEQWEK